MQEKGVRDKSGSFVFRVKVGECEVEVSGVREEVLKTVGELPGLMGDVYKAFEGLKPKGDAAVTVTVKQDAAKAEALMQKPPKIKRTDRCDEAVLRILETDWGKWRPRTIEELKGALRANELSFAGRILAGVLMGLVSSGKVRRWKTDSGYVYILAEKEELA